MKAKQIKVGGFFEQKINTGNYSNVTFGSSFEVTSDIEEDDTVLESYEKQYSAIQKKIELEVNKQILEYIESKKNKGEKNGSL